MKVLLAGSRGWRDPKPVEALIAGLDLVAEGRNEKLTIIHGAAPGLDRLAGEIAKQWGVNVIAEPANWNQYGKAAGVIRNQKMLDEHQPEVAYCFRATGKSNGTDDMYDRAKAAGIPTYLIQ